MQNNLIKERLENKMDAKVYAEGEGCSMSITVVSELFTNLNQLKRQQLVYSHITDLIKSGEVHAVQMKTLTPSEWLNITNQ